MPRIIGTRCGVNTSVTGVALRRASSCDDFRVVAMALDAVGLEVVGGLGEEQADLGLAAGAGDAGLAVGDQVPASTTPASSSGSEAQLHRVG